MSLNKIAVMIGIFLLCMVSVSKVSLDAKNQIKKQSRVYVTVSALKIRKEPNLEATAIGKLLKGDSFVVFEESETTSEVEGIQAKWGRVFVKGMKGWVFLGFTSPIAPELLTDKEIERITKKYERDVKECERKEEEAMAADPEYQNCSSCGCNLQTSQSVNIDRGCTPYKIKEIAELAKKNGSTLNVPDREIFEAYGDEYCLNASKEYGGDCYGMKLNLYKSFKDLD
ncbi:SH3 domain-containing protein [Leptospira sp. WS39.C2]